jgi:adenylate cyclase
LAGREAEVTLLFCDVRGFSRASERLGPAGTVKWINDVMAELSRCVLAEGGVLVDYIGDELLAMWGAPQPQPDQAARAARAALAMRAALAPLNARWQETLGGPMDVGVGLNTGSARVGNTGSEYKFKYGPLGNPVNLASRVQGLTKYLRCRVLATAETRSRLGPGFAARRVCKARVVNIQEPVDLYEIEASGCGDREEFFRASEAALDALEGGGFALAARRAGSLVEVHPDDGPLLLVLSRATTMLVNGGAFDPVWEPPGK